MMRSARFAMMTMFTCSSFPFLLAAGLEESWIPLNEEGNRRRELGLCRQAVPILLRARTAAIKELGPNDASVAIPTNNLAAAYLCLEKFTAAEGHFRDALALLDGGRSPVIEIGILNNLGVLLMRSSRPNEAGEILHRALALTEAVHGAHHPAVAVAISSLGLLRLHASQYRQARELFERALVIWEASFGDHTATAAALNNLGVVNFHLLDYQQARDLTGRALDMRRRLLPPRHPDIAQSLYNHAVVLRKLGQRKPARSLFRQAASISSAFASENLVGMTVDIGTLSGR